MHHQARGSRRRGWTTMAVRLHVRLKIRLLANNLWLGINELLDMLVTKNIKALGVPMPHDPHADEHHAALGDR